MGSVRELIAQREKAAVDAKKDKSDSDLLRNRLERPSSQRLESSGLLQKWKEREGQSKAPPRPAKVDRSGSQRSSSTDSAETEGGKGRVAELRSRLATKTMNEEAPPPRPRPLPARTSAIERGKSVPAISTERQVVLPTRLKSTDDEQEPLSTDEDVTKRWSSSPLSLPAQQQLKSSSNSETDDPKPHAEPQKRVVPAPKPKEKPRESLSSGSLATRLKMLNLSHVRAGPPPPRPKPVETTLKKSKEEEEEDDEKEGSPTLTHATLDRPAITQQRRRPQSMHAKAGVPLAGMHKTKSSQSIKSEPGALHHACLERPVIKKNRRRPKSVQMLALKEISPIAEEIAHEMSLSCKSKSMPELKEDSHPPPEKAPERDELEDSDDGEQEDEDEPKEKEQEEMQPAERKEGKDEEVEISKSEDAEVESESRLRILPTKLEPKSDDDFEHIEHEDLAEEADAAKVGEEKHIKEADGADEDEEERRRKKKERKEKKKKKKSRRDSEIDDKKRKRRGVDGRKSFRFIARARVDGEVIQLGIFDNEEEAVETVKDKYFELYGEAPGDTEEVDHNFELVERVPKTRSIDLGKESTDGASAVHAHAHDDDDLI